MTSFGAFWEVIFAFELHVLHA